MALPSKNALRELMELTELTELSQLIVSDLPEMVASTALRNLPSTRAGGQDDVSSQANSLKQELHRLTWIDVY